MNWETVTQVLKTAGLAVVGTLASKLVSETESQLAKTKNDEEETDTTDRTHKDTLTYLKQRTKELGIR
jgi:hypothetical protein